MCRLEQHASHAVGYAVNAPKLCHRVPDAGVHLVGLEHVDHGWRNRGPLGEALLQVGELGLITGGKHELCTVGCKQLHELGADATGGAKHDIGGRGCEAWSGLIPQVPSRTCRCGEAAACLHGYAGHARERPQQLGCHRNELDDVRDHDVAGKSNLQYTASYYLWSHTHNKSEGIMVEDEAPHLPPRHQPLPAADQPLDAHVHGAAIPTSTP